MGIVEFAEKYCAERDLARTPVYSANRFARFVGNIPPGDISDADLLKYRQAMEQAGLKAWTVRGGVKDICTLIKAAGSAVQKPVVRVPSPEPNPVPLERIDAIWPYLPAWGRQWLMVSYWSGLRLADTINLQQTDMLAGEFIQWRASKTDRRHQLPRPDWLIPHLSRLPLPYGVCEDHNGVLVRDCLEQASKAAGVPRVLPSEIRDRSLTEWLRADGTAGKMIHGCGLGILDHYAGRLDLIASAGMRLRLPSCFGVQQDDTENISMAIRRLDIEGRQIVRMTVSRLLR